MTQQAVVTQKNISEFFPPAGDASILSYESGHDFEHLVPEEEAGYVLRHGFVREYSSWHNNPGEMGFMIVGPTGSGKTTAVLAINHHLNIPTIVVSCHRDMTLLELKGSMAFVTDETTNQTVTQFKLGTLAMAFKHGFAVIMDENNMLEPDVNAGINEIVRGKTMLIEQTGEVIKRHPMFRIIATGNDWGRGDAEMRLAGVKMQNSAYLNRWWKFNMPYPDASIEEAILEGKHPNLPDVVRKGMVSVASLIRQSILGIGDDTKANLDVDFSTRTLLEWADKSLRFAKAPNPLQYSLEIVLLRSCDATEREVIERACHDKLGESYADV